MNEWKKHKLSNIISVKHGYAFKGEFFSDEPTKNILLTPGNFNIGGGFKSDKLKYYNGQIPKDYILSKGEIIVTMTDLSKQADTLGYSAKIPNDTSKVFLHNQRVGLVKLINNDFDADFVYWLLRTYEYQRFIAGSATGATVKHTSPSKIGFYEFIAPIDKNIQQRIASILSAYDDLIENNLKRIKLLEELAQRIFSDYYKSLTSGNSCISNIGVYVEHEIGGGWGNDILTPEFCEPAYVIRGTDIDVIQAGNNKNVPLRFHKASNLKSRKLVTGDIIFEVSGGSQNEGVAKSLLITNNLLDQFNEDVMCASFCKLLRPSDTNMSIWLFLFFRYLRMMKYTEIYEIRSASNIVNYNWTAFLKFQRIKVPNDKILERFNIQAVSIYRQINNLSSQINKLKESRDLLLPRLMNGTVKIDEP